MVYKYGQPVKRSRRSVKKYFVGGFASLALVAVSAVPAFASHTPVVSENAATNGCFGQARAAHAKGGPNSALLPGSDTQGTYSSERKGDNASMNAEYREMCQAL